MAERFWAYELVDVEFCAYRFVEFRLETVPVDAVSVPTFAVVDETYCTERLVPVAFWKLSPVNQPIQRSAAEPRERMPSADGRNEPVEVPPANWSALVVVFPVFVTVCRFGVVPEGQFVPFERHGATPLMRICVVETEPMAANVTARFVDVTLFRFALVALTVVPEAVPKPKSVAYRLPDVAETNVAKFAPRFEAYRFVLVVFVPVALVQTMFVKLAEAAVKGPDV